LAWPAGGAGSSSTKVAWAGAPFAAPPLEVGGIDPERSRGPVQAVGVGGGDRHRLQRVRDGGAALPRSPPVLEAPLRSVEGAGTGRNRGGAHQLSSFQY
jgi:hypothetical protein